MLLHLSVSHQYCVEECGVCCRSMEGQ
ncbi:MAG TPA: hypothetical protein DCE41_23510 [Cytophagales bacterium]|nr:hypothetical protein [Cytophagales bacterium]HAA23666.1 hypothetical protein [Cytophagales bacterium]HAP59258.1 hypothetical protein [Cytophagales bacterium]